MTLEELRTKVEEWAELVGTEDDRFAHNIVGLYLGEIAQNYGRLEANSAIEDFSLAILGWRKRTA